MHTCGPLGYPLLRATQRFEVRRTTPGTSGRPACEQSGNLLGVGAAWVLLDQPVAADLGLCVAAELDQRVNRQELPLGGELTAREFAAVAAQRQQRRVGA